MDGIFYKGVHSPVSGALADATHEIVQHLRALYGMQHLGMELNGIQIFLSTFCCRHRTVGGDCHGTKTGGQLGNIIKMAHPTHSMGSNSLEQFGGDIHIYFCLAVLSHLGSLYLTAQYMRHQLCTITQPQHRDAQLKQLFRAGSSTFLITAAGTAGENDSLGIHGFNLSQICFIGIDFTINIAFSHTSGNQLVVLTAEIKNHNHLSFHRNNHAFLLSAAIRWKSTSGCNLMCFSILSL